MDDTDVLFTPDHGGMDGENGLMLIGPALVDSLCRMPLIWKPAKNADVPAAEVSVITQYESHTPEVSIIMNGVYADGMYCTAYERTVTYDGTEGELYDLGEDPRQRVNLWDDPARQAVRDDMRAIIYDTLFTRPLFHPKPEPGALI